MDSDARAAAADPRLSAADNRGGPNSNCKLARTDTFPLRMQFQNHEFRDSLVRSNSSILPHYRLGGCPSSLSSGVASNVDGHSLFAGGDASYLSDERQFRNESLLSGAGIVALQQHQQVPPSRPAGLLTAYGEVERAGEASLLQPQSPVPVFTSSQLRELQLHALIFKHMVCGVSVPAELVLLVRTSVAALAGMSTAAAHLGSLGWGNYHVGYGNSVDPEPGRCRRTDGKKWRCARDVVPDQKYCERHMHRGRHRARKPPEPLPLPAASASASSIATALPRSAAGTPSSSPTAPFLPPVKASSPHQLALQAARSLDHDECAALQSKLHGAGQGGGLSVVPPAGSNPMMAFRHPFLGGGGTYDGSSVSSMGRGEPEGQPLRHFFDDWPRRREHSSLTWPDMEGSSEQQRLSVYGARSASTTQLSISIPSVQVGFACNGGSSSPRGGKLALSPLKLSMSRGEDDPLGVEAATQMGLGVGLGVNETDSRQRQSGSSWLPISWETGSVGGPLAEVLQSSGNTPQGGGSHGTPGARRSSLNLMSEVWESSPQSSPPSSSPTGVLQINATFGCFSSDNSTASSPRSAALKLSKEPAI